MAEQDYDRRNDERAELDARPVERLDAGADAARVDVRRLPHLRGTARCENRGGSSVSGGAATGAHADDGDRLPEQASAGLTPARREAIVRLLETRDEHLPLPVRRDHSPSGFVGGGRSRTCPDCLANGRTMFGCESCGGSGVINPARLGSLAVPDEQPDDLDRRDPYAQNDVQPFGLDPTRHDHTRARDAEIDRLAMQTRDPWKTPEDELADANRHPYAWEEARRHMYAAFDYLALDRVLEQLRQADGAAYALIHSVHVYGWQQNPAATVEAIVDRGLAFLDARMPDPLRAPEPEKEPQLAVGRVARAAGTAALEQRDDEIVNAILVDGTPTADVAARWHLTVRQVNKIVSKAQRGEAA